MRNTKMLLFGWMLFLPTLGMAATVCTQCTLHSNGLQDGAGRCWEHTKPAQFELNMKVEDFSAVFSRGKGIHFRLEDERTGKKIEADNYPGLGDTLEVKDANGTIRTATLTCEDFA